MNKKFKKLLLVVLIGVFAFSALNVSAAFTEENTTRIGYEIQGFNVFIFNDTGMTQTQKEVTDGNIKSFPVGDLRMNPVTEVKDENGYSLVSVKLNFDGGLETLKEITSNIASQNKDSLSGGSNGKYLISFSVKYKLNLPEGISSVYDSDYPNIFSGNQKLLKNENEANSSIGLDQMIICGVYDSNTDTIDWSNGATYNYHTENGDHIFTSRSHLIPYFDQYLIFEDVKKPEDQEIGDQASYSMKESYGETYRFMMYESEIGTPIEDPTPSDPGNSDEPSTDEPSTENPEPSNPGSDEPSTDDPTPSEPEKPTPSNPNKDDDNSNSNPLIPDHTIPGNPSNDDSSNNDEPSIGDSDDNNGNSDTVVIPSDDNNNNNPNGTNTSSKGSGSVVSQKVSVPNTASNSNIKITMFGILLLASGCGIVMLTKKESSI